MLLYMQDTTYASEGTYMNLLLYAPFKVAEVHNIKRQV